ncbi:MAG TPA: hypothetical protein PK109_00075 [Candidatus Paceibacterota bacterium]|nr:hypothetical protein [Candidatus Paceibacterota bacterium]
MAYTDQNKGDIKELVRKAYKILDEALYIFDEKTEGNQDRVARTLADAAKYLDRARNWIRER